LFNQPLQRTALQSRVEFLLDLIFLSAAALYIDQVSRIALNTYLVSPRPPNQKDKKISCMLLAQVSLRVGFGFSIRYVGPLKELMRYRVDRSALVYLY
jgi:hypothetical protein